MMMIMQDGKRSFEQGFQTVSPYYYTRPPSVDPAVSMVLHPCLSLENLMLMPRNLLCAVCLSIRIQICHRGSLW